MPAIKSSGEPKGTTGAGAGESPGLSARMSLLFAVAGGLSVANVYYAQALLDLIAADLAITTASVGLIITLTQIGYAVGLIFIVPLGDILDRRKLILCQALLSSAALAGVAVARTEEWLLIAMVLVGVLAVVVQVLVVFSASLAAPAARGKAVGTVTSGIVVGILLARFVAGVLADFGGWRAIYAASAAVTLAMAGLLYRSLPQDDGARTPIRYVALLRSVAFLYAEMPLLRWRGALGFLVFATLGTLWTSLVLPLSAAPISTAIPRSASWAWPAPGER
jgi:predicted MFS family arabinose efflux permease